MSENSPEYDAMHHLQSTLSLLGAHELIPLVSKLMDRQVSQKDVDDLMNYNIKLFESSKNRLAHIHTFKIKTSGSMEGEKE